MAMYAYNTTATSEHDLQPLQKKFDGLPMQLSTAAGNIDAVLHLAAEARAVPLHEIVPLQSSKEGSQAIASLREIRSKFIIRVIVFREVLLPVSSRVVNALHSLLDYMEDEELFLDLAKAGEVSHLCNEHAQDAADVQKGYETLSSDLLALTDIMDTKFKKVNLDIKALAEKYATHNSHKQKLGWAAGGLAVAGVVGGSALAMCLLGPGGVLFAPHLAAGALGASCASGSGLAVGFKCASDAAAAKAVAVRESAKVLGDAQRAAEGQLPEAVRKFAGAMAHLAEFFSLLGNSVQRIESSAARIECRLKKEAELDKCYTALYKTLCRQMAAVKQSCDAYQRFVSNVHVKVDHLKLGEDQPALSYIEEWFQEQQEAVASRGCLAHLHRLKEMAANPRRRTQQQQRLADRKAAAQA